MTSDGRTSVTHLLDALDRGDRGAFARLVELTYADMRRLASVRLEPRPDHRLAADGLGPTALAHERIERLQNQQEIAENREHFFALATRLMMQILLDHRRRVRAHRRGGGAVVGSLERAGEVPAGRAGDGVEVSELMRHALLQLHKLVPRKARRS